jgi:hypothetical protein
MNWNKLAQDTGTWRAFFQLGSKLFCSVNIRNFLTLNFSTSEGVSQS